MVIMVLMKLMVIKVDKCCAGKDGDSVDEQK
jgi:hypothetical protein